VCSNTQIPKPPPGKTQPFNFTQFNYTKFIITPSETTPPLLKEITSKPRSTHHPHIRLATEKQSNQPTRSSFTEIRTFPKCNKAGNLLRISPRGESELKPTL